MILAGLYARVSTQDQQTLPMQNRAMREYAAAKAALSFRRVDIDLMPSHGISSVRRTSSKPRNAMEAIHETYGTDNPD
jgi:hypothetical protein